MQRWGQAGDRLAGYASVARASMHAPSRDPPVTAPTPLLVVDVTPELRFTKVLSLCRVNCQDAAALEASLQQQDAVLPNGVKLPTGNSCAADFRVDTSFEEDFLGQDTVKAGRKGQGKDNAQLCRCCQRQQSSLNGGIVDQTALRQASSQPLCSCTVP